MISKAPPTAKQTAARQGRTGVNGTPRSTGGQVSNAERNQRVAAAQASARKRKGSGTKQKNPMTRETKARERVRPRKNQMTGTPQLQGEAQKMALAQLKISMDTGRPVKMNAKQMMSALADSKKRGLKVKQTGKKSASITLKDGRTIHVEST